MNKILKWTALSAIVMLLFPLIAVTFVPSNAGMMIMMLMFLIINPIYYIVIGVVSSNDVKRMWVLPVVSSVLFLVGTYMFLGKNVSAFLMYALIYFIISMGSMFISDLIKRNKRI